MSSTALGFELVDSLWIWGFIIIQIAEANIPEDNKGRSKILCSSKSQEEEPQHAVQGPPGQHQ